MKRYNNNKLNVPPTGHPSYSLVVEGLPGNLRKYAAREYKENIENFIPRGGLANFSTIFRFKFSHLMISHLYETLFSV